MAKFFTLQIFLFLFFYALGSNRHLYNYNNKNASDFKQDTCNHISTLPCSAIQVSLPYSLSFNTAIPGSIVDKFGQGTGFTTVNKYSGTRLSEDGLPSNALVPGYEPSKIAITGGQLHLVTNKGVDILTNNNQLNVLGVKIATAKKLQIEVKVINPFNGTLSQQAGIWYGLNDKTYIKLDIIGSKVELRKEVNDATSSVTGNANPDQRITALISNLNTKTVRLRLVIDSVAKTAEGFYSTDGINYISTGAAYSIRSLNIAGTHLTDNVAYAGIFATHRNATTAVTYNFDDFQMSDVASVTKILSFSKSTLNLTVIKGGKILPQSIYLTSNVALPPTFSFSKTNAAWLHLPQPPNDTLVFNSQLIDSTTSVGNYQALLTCAATGYQSAVLLINFNVINALKPQTVNVNFQDLPTIPPLNYLRDYGQAYGLRTGLNQGNGFEFGWKRRSDGTLINITGNGRNRGYPEDLLLATLICMQANSISGTFNGIKVESYWDIKVPNGTYDATVSVGDGFVGSSPESHSINIEAVNAISHFVPIGKQGSIGRFKSATSRVTVSDEHMTINADGGTNTKINFVSITPVSISPYLFWGKSNQDLIINAGTPQTRSFPVTLGSSNNSATTYKLTVSYDKLKDWLNFNSTQTGKQPIVNFNYTAAKNLPVGIYRATVSATSSQFTSATFAVQVAVVDSLRPYVVSSSPLNGAVNVPVNTVSIAANNLHIPVVAGYPGGVDNSTITSSSVRLYQLVDTSSVLVPGVVQGTGGGDAISISPSSALMPNSRYKFVVTSLVKSYPGAAFAPYEAIFTTAAANPDSTNILNAQFTKIPVAGTQNKKYTSLAIGPDGKFYALRIDGTIERYLINHTNGSLTMDKTIKTLVNKYGGRTAIGLTFDPQSTPSNVIIWVSHSSAGLTAAPSFDGNISRLQGDSLQNEQLIITKLPRSTRDHMVNGLAFGPDNALYICQGSNSSAGLYDNDWQRSETLLSGTILRLSLNKLNSFALPLNVQTTANLSVINSAPSNLAVMSDGTYNPYGSASPLTIYASGVRNAFDMVWHSNGQLYLPTNGSGGGGNSPASVNGTRRPNGTFYQGPSIPATTGVKVQSDWLFRVNPAMPVGFYGHPNPLRGEYVINRGYIDNPLYPPSIVSDPNYRPAYNFGLNNSPDGALEYKSNTFNGALKGKLLICRFSGGGDIIVMEPGSLVKTTYVGNDDHIYDIVKVNTGSGNSGLVGMSGFGNPLDIVEDVVNGNLYINEFNWNNNPNLTSQITLLKVTTASQPMSVLALTAIPQALANDYEDKEYQVTISNKGDGILKVKDISLYGNDASKFKIADIQLPSGKMPLVLNKNRSLTFKVYTKSSLKEALNAKLRVISIDDTIKTVDIDNSAHVDSIIIKNEDQKRIVKLPKDDGRILKVYPNPNTAGKIYVSLKNFKAKEDVSVYLFDMTGKRIETIATQANIQGEINIQFEIKNIIENKFFIIRAVYSTGFKYAKVIVNNMN
ncbi:Ig-like domain-containing protein [Mucilaginibacter sp.]|uniref:Ig-like domain-containing protein n=1 Tax=Mucilaginibacter sp. TaxID=1882438 RepID=UPI00260EC628|nr:Ig-like domain-containing protein [Mucilaginibacter sp.]MDB4919439.1 hypothetical protein [Mucilaginibacter sp.]